MLMASRRFLYKYKRFEKETKKKIIQFPAARKIVYKAIRYHRNYHSLSKKEPLVNKIEEFLQDEVFMTIFQAFFGDDLGTYVSNNMVSFYSNKISYTISLILRDLGMKTIMHNFEHNQCIIIAISYAIAIIGIFIEVELPTTK